MSSQRRGSPFSVVFITFLTAISVLVTTQNANAFALPPISPVSLVGSIAETAATTGEGVAVGTIVSGGAFFEVTASVAVGAFLTGYGGGTLAWKLGNALGQALPCLDCPDIGPNPSRSGIGQFASGQQSATEYSVFAYQFGRNGYDCSAVYTVTSATLSAGSLSGDIHVDFSGGACGANNPDYNKAFIAAQTSPGAGTCCTSGGNTGVVYQLNTTTGNLHFTGLGVNGYVHSLVITSSATGRNNGVSWNVECMNTPTGSACPPASSLDGYSPPISVSGTTATPTPTGESLSVQSHGNCTSSANPANNTPVTASSTAFKATDPKYPPIVAPVCPAGTTLTEFGADVVPLSTGSTIKTTPLIISKPIPNTNNPPAGHPEYAPNLPGGANYPAKLTMTITLTDGTEKPYDPFTDPVPDPNNTVDQRTFHCKWGGLAVALSECSPIYKQAPPKAPPIPEVSTDFGNCVTTGISFNPITWVYIPVKCALQWAFVPSAATVTGWQNRVATIKANPPISVASQGTQYIKDQFVIAGDSDCSNPTTVDASPLGQKGTLEFDPICAIGRIEQNTTTGMIIYNIFRVGIFIAAGFFVWIRVFRSVGSKDEVEA